MEVLGRDANATWCSRRGKRCPSESPRVCSYVRNKEGNINSGTIGLIEDVIENYS